jgi:hypothetical protein
MSKREDIAANIVTVLDAMSSPTLKKITRDPFQADELSDQQFPACWISTSEEVRTDTTMGNTTRQGTIDYVIVGYVKGSGIDTSRNELIEGIEEALDADRTRGGNALNTETVLVETDEGLLFPVGGIRVTVRVTYDFTQGAT